METIVIRDNNPNAVNGMVLMLFATIIVTLLIQIVLLYRRRNRLIEVHRKIVARHEQILNDVWREGVRSEKYRKKMESHSTNGGNGTSPNGL